MIAGTAFWFEDNWRGALQALPQRRLSRAVQPDVLKAIVGKLEAGRAYALTCPGGLIVVAMRGARGATMVFDVLLAVSDGTPGAFRRFEQDVVRLAEDAGAHVLAFRTDRRGWRRMLGPAWKDAGGHFVRELL